MLTLLRSRVDDGFSTHWTPCKDENGVTHRVVSHLSEPLVLMSPLTISLAGYDFEPSIVLIYGRPHPDMMIGTKRAGCVRSLLHSLTFCKLSAGFCFI